VSKTKSTKPPKRVQLKVGEGWLVESVLALADACHELGRDGFHSVPIFPGSKTKIWDGVESVPTKFMARQ
jgi:hypothetical protein